MTSGRNGGSASGPCGRRMLRAMVAVAMAIVAALAWLLFGSPRRVSHTPAPTSAVEEAGPPSDPGGTAGDRPVPPAPDRLVGMPHGPPEGTASFYADYAATLEKYVDRDGMVAYAELKADRKRLDAFAATLGKLPPETFAGWTVKAGLAFWINAYNALTLKAIIDHYPPGGSGISARRYPKSSIRRIPGVWTRLRFRVMGNEMTLDEIEHGVLRKEFSEPRIHFALVCAAMGCPPLRDEPFEAGKLDSQLDDQAERFLADPRKFRLDRARGRAYLSSIFKWYGGDFVEVHGTDEKFRRQGEALRAVLNFISGYLPEEDRAFLEDAPLSVSYLSYDWSLNERPPRERESEHDAEEGGGE